MASKPLIQCFVDDFDQLIDKYRGEGITFAEAIGGVEITKLALYEEMSKSTEDEDNIF